MCRMKPVYQRQEGCSSTKYSPTSAFFKVGEKKEQKKQTNKQTKLQMLSKLGIMSCSERSEVVICLVYQKKIESQFDKHINNSRGRRHRTPPDSFINQRTA